ncbi:MAG TPA: hypothetical protein VMF59_06235 [Bacteroidota bacterium]|nr:hypothetical protein [Bacteroidota bacterium]
MSLKAFHLLFVTASAILAFGFGAWGIDAYATRGEGGSLVLGLCALLFGAGLVVYGVIVRTKLKGLGLR